MPGIKDFVIIKTAHSREKIQKRIMTMTLKEAYEEFQKEYPDQKISFAKYARLRPAHVILFSQSKQWSCLCIYCTNMDFIIYSLLPFLTSYLSLKELMSKVSCHVDNYDCASGICEQCFDVMDVIMNLLKPGIEDHLVGYQQWETVNKLVQKVSHALVINDILLVLEEKMQKYKMHYFLIKTQLSIFRHLKENLESDNICLIVDYAENYSCSQDEISSAYFGRRQISLFTSIAYVGKEHPISIVIANDCISHNKEQVWFYIKFIVNFLQSLFDDIKIVNVFSDGACSQFKRIKEDFNVDLKWNFFPTAHGKTSADGVGAIVKWGVYARVLSGKWEVNCAEQFVSCANSFKNSIHVFEIKQNEIDRECIGLQQRYKNVK